MSNTNYNTPKLDKQGLIQVWNAIIENFIAKGDADSNVIESIKVNGVALEVTDKGVNIVVPQGALASLDKVDQAHLADELVTLITGKADKATTLAGYGITDAYTKEETATQIENAVKSAVTGVYKYKGSCAFANLPTNASAGDVYNITDDFTTTAAFAEGAGHEYKAGTNVAMDDNGKWDCMAGIHDYSEFMMKSDIVNITDEEINAICVMPV